ncbi:hypothetical protein [Aureliella helgolandensis]|uniref:Tetratricopeptide repeat protein n=1 Tax=Aureliella helgolandensis TaxID=2527968 RepID=A0A518G873_9BACT|nr:hypothetical protein [Aureliella helgolandensis]QDV24788.1 Tetratricopeptide repeat protein [Aureliella helgolandensis]
MILAATHRTFLLLFVACSIAAHPAHRSMLYAESPISEYFDIGQFERPVQTKSPDAQIWFNRGLAMCYAFNHEEGTRCFEKAFAADPTCSLALWGLAYSLGPNFNNMEIGVEQLSRAQMAIRLAQLSAGNGDSVEFGLINALATRHAALADGKRNAHREYADAMREVYQEHADDPDVCTLFAESLITLQPWKHWSNSGVPASETEEIVRVLESALERSPEHPGLCHFYVHVREMSPTPGMASPAANVLRETMPDAGHLVHMPSHIDIQLGEYEQVILANQKAIEADNKFVKAQGRDNFYTYYRIHNYHFAVYGAMFDGQSELASEMARAIPDQIPQDMLRTQTDFLDAFMPTTLHVMIRFGRWDDILGEEQPEEWLPVSRSIWHYARGLAYAAKGMVSEAELEQRAFIASRNRVPETSVLFNNTSREILGVAESMLAGEIAYRRGEHDEAFAKLRESVERADSLNYDEPWGWMQPPRHALGALLLEQNLLEEAEAVYCADLERHPRNLWSLQGLTEILRKQGNAKELRQTEAQLESASRRADFVVDRSCFCRLSTDESCCAPSER